MTMFNQTEQAVSSILLPALCVHISHADHTAWAEARGSDRFHRVVAWRVTCVHSTEPILVSHRICALL
jgi:hypothetical protein